MKILRYVIENIGIIKHEEIIINNSLTVFYGRIKQGKTTIAKTAIIFCLGGKIPDDFLRHGEKKGYVQIFFDQGYIKRTIKKDKKGNLVSTAKDIEYVDSEGEFKEIKLGDLKKFLNPFMLDQHHFSNLQGVEKDKFFVELFNINTSDLDKKINKLVKENADYRIKIDAAGNIDTAKVEKPTGDLLNIQLASITEDVEVKKQEVTKYNTLIKDDQTEIDRISAIILSHTNEIVELQEIIEKKQIIINNSSLAKSALEKNLKNPIAIPDELLKKQEDIKIEIASLKPKLELYKQYLDRVEAQKLKDSNIAIVQDNEQELRDLRKSKLMRLSEINQTCGIPNLKFNENAKATYQDTSLDMLSGSQETELGYALQKLYPNDLKLELLNEGESLGDSIFEYIHKAEETESTILVACVGDRPAEIPARVGVFVVEDGKVQNV